MSCELTSIAVYDEIYDKLGEFPPECTADEILAALQSEALTGIGTGIGHWQSAIHAAIPAATDDLIHDHLVNDGHPCPDMLVARPIPTQFLRKLLFFSLLEQFDRIYPKIAASLSCIKNDARILSSEQNPNLKMVPQNACLDAVIHYYSGAVLLTDHQRHFVKFAIASLGIACLSDAFLLIPFMMCADFDASMYFVLKPRSGMHNNNNNDGLAKRKDEVYKSSKDKVAKNPLNGVRWEHAFRVMQWITRTTSSALARSLPHVDRNGPGAGFLTDATHAFESFGFSNHIDVESSKLLFDQVLMLQRSLFHEDGNSQFHLLYAKFISALVKSKPKTIFPDMEKVSSGKLAAPAEPRKAHVDSKIFASSLGIVAVETEVVSLVLNRPVASPGEYTEEQMLRDATDLENDDGSALESPKPLTSQRRSLPSAAKPTLQAAVQAVTVATWLSATNRNSVKIRIPPFSAVGDIPQEKRSTEAQDRTPAAPNNAHSAGRQGLNSPGITAQPPQSPKNNAHAATSPSSSARASQVTVDTGTETSGRTTNPPIMSPTIARVQSSQPMPSPVSPRFSAARSQTGGSGGGEGSSKEQPPIVMDPLVILGIHQVISLFKMCAYDYDPDVYDEICADVAEDDLALSDALIKVFGKTKDPRAELRNMKESKREATIKKCEKTFLEIRAKREKERQKLLLKNKKS
eukprot:ANDGO_03950.mRNA.1 hypothetical protein